jgi:hypothetical protein
MNLQNAHVLKYYRWEIWLARHCGRLMAVTVFTKMHNDELLKMGATK